MQRLSGLKVIDDPPEGHQPPARWAHTVTHTPQGLLLFGGFASRQYKNDAWLILPSSEPVELRSTDRIQGSDASGAPPPGVAVAAYASQDGLSAGDSAAYPSVRSNLTALAIDDSVVLFGGGLNKQKYGDAYLLRVARTGQAGKHVLQTCRLRTPGAVAARPKNFAAGCRLTRRVFAIFGGVDDKSRDSEELCLGTLERTPLAISQAEGPGARLVGNLAPLPPQTLRWRIEASGGALGGAQPSAPAPRKCHVMLAAPAPFPTPEDACMALLHGGCHSESYVPYADTWVLMPLSSGVAASAPPHTPGGVFSASDADAAGSAAGGAGSAGGGLLQYTWVRPDIRGAPPSARWGHAASLVPGRDPSESAFLVVGGFGGPGEAAHEGGGASASSSSSSSNNNNAPPQGQRPPEGANVDLNDLYVGVLTVSSSAAEMNAGENRMPLPSLSAFSLPPASYPREYFAAGCAVTWTRVACGVSFPPRRRLGADLLPSAGGGGAAKAPGRGGGGRGGRRQPRHLWRLLTPRQLPWGPVGH